MSNVQQVQDKPAATDAKSPVWTSPWVMIPGTLAGFLIGLAMEELGYAPSSYPYTFLAILGITSLLIVLVAKANHRP